MKFGKEMDEEAREEWREKYINYTALKKKLMELKDEVDNPHPNPAVLEAKRAIFQGYLDSEIEKVVLWYKSCLDSMQQNVATLERDLAMAPQVLSDASIDTEFKLKGLTTLRNRWRKLGGELAMLLEYVSLNMTAMRKILKKYAKHMEPTKPMEGYCTLEIQHPDDPSWAFVQGTFLPDYVAQELDRMQNDPAINDIQESARVALGYVNMIHKDLLTAAPDPREHALVAVEVPPLFAPANSQRLGLGSSGRHPQARLLTRQDTERHTSVEEHELLHQIDIAAHQALVSSRLVRSRPWSIMQAGIFEDPPAELAANGNTMGLWITLTMSFLHAAVYYLPTPVTHSLCRGLKVDLSLSALVFAVADIGEFLASFVFTYWTNTNYRHPLLFGALCGVLGCLLTSAAFDAPKSMGWGLMLSGRFLLGSAASRTICRRYIADCISLQERTQASLAMVIASNLGMAVGFLGAIPIRKVFHAFEGQPAEVMGYVGSILWLVALVAGTLFFQDPHRGNADARSDLEAPLNPSNEHGSPGPQGMMKSPTQTALMISQTSWAGEDDGEEAELDWDRRSAQDGPQGVQPLYNSAEIQRKPPFLRQLFQSAISSPNVLWEEIREALVPTICCFVCLAAVKLALAVFSTSLNLFSHGSLWYWKEHNRALLLGLVALTMLPAGYAASRMSQSSSDRRMLAFAISFTIFSCCVLYQLGASDLHKALYISGAILMHMSVVGIEGGSLSLLSKVIHPSMARGPVNTGLLTTVAGTVGRFLGNMLVLGLASLIPVDQTSPEFELVQFAHVLYGTLSALLVCSLIYVFGIYQQLK